MLRSYRIYRTLFRRALSRSHLACVGVHRRVCTLFAMLTFGEFGPRSIMCPHVIVRGRANIHVKANSIINEASLLHAPGDAMIVIGRRTVLSFGCKILTGTLDPTRTNSHIWRDVIIEDDVWVCAGATILPGVTIGKGSIVAAGAVVTRDVPPGMLVAGIPAVPKRKLN